MKKLVAALLTLTMVMTMSLTAFAANEVKNTDGTTAGTGTVNVSTSVTPGFTVVIPEDITITENTVTTNVSAVTLSEGGHIAAGKNVQVTAALSAIKCGDVTLAAALSDSTDTFEVDGEAKTGTQKTITIEASAWKAAKSGAYTGTITYTVSVVAAGN